MFLTPVSETCPRVLGGVGRDFVDSMDALLFVHLKVDRYFLHRRTAVFSD